MQAEHRPQEYAHFSQVRVAACAEATHTEQTILEELLEKIVEGDQSSLATLYALTSKRVHGLIFSILGHREDSEEATSDTYIKIWNSSSHYDAGKSTVIAWICMIARTRAIDHYRKTRRYTQACTSECAGSGSSYASAEWRSTRRRAARPAEARDSSEGDADPPAIASTDSHLGLLRRTYAC